MLTSLFPLYADSGGEVANTSSDIPSETCSSVQKKESAVSNGHSDNEPSLCIAVIGATGELARNKVFPALFALYYSGFLPRV